MVGKAPSSGRDALSSLWGSRTTTCPSNGCLSGLSLQAVRPFLYGPNWHQLCQNAANAREVGVAPAGARQRGTHRPAGPGTGSFAAADAHVAPAGAEQRV